MVIKTKRFSLQLFSAFMLLASVSALLQSYFTDWNGHDLTAGFLVFLGTVYIICDLKKQPRFEQRALLCGYGIRCLMVISQAYFDSVLNVFVLGTDAVKFYRVSLDYYNGIFHEFYTNYPYVLNFLHHVFGPGKMIPLYLNVFCWYLCWCLIRLFMADCAGRYQKLIVICYSLMPIGIFMTSELLRESIMMLLTGISVYFLWRWMENGRLRYAVLSFISAMPSVLLHPITIALIAGIAFTYLFWSPISHKWHMGRYKVCFLALCLVAAYIFFHFKIYARWGYFPQTLSLETITNRHYEDGGADYLRNIRVTTILQFIFWTPVRSFYFWFSPLMGQWRGMKDMIAFVADSLLFLVLFVLILRNRKKNPEFMMGIVILAAYTFIYAWSTSNAGTAMRHRNMLLAVCLMTLGMTQQKMAVRNDS